MRIPQPPRSSFPPRRTILSSQATREEGANRSTPYRYLSSDWFSRHSVSAAANSEKALRDGCCLPWCCYAEDLLWMDVPQRRISGTWALLQELTPSPSRQRQ